ncbi:unnamed protein product [Trichogramma brassicae]|uniref:FP protein C-terminal domain-containing protein n=1 Tax=Trichogramma brassicae TaxID=86971 RepID=A0A6H5IYG1_9HYME|nr:unnamed protein product [Trichogramma brassicae]
MSQSDTSCPATFQAETEHIIKYIDMVNQKLVDKMYGIMDRLMDKVEGLSSLASTGVSLLRLLPSGPTTIVLLRLCERRLGVLASSRVPLPAAAPVADHDTCEVRVSGIPLSVDVTSSATAERIVSALELDRLRPHILSVREWAPRRRTPVAAPSTSNAVLDLEMKTMVIRFSSANARETFLAAAPKFQRLSTHAIFGIADDGRPNHLRANVILPSDRHRLYRRCAAAAEAHGYPRPFVRNLCIYMRRARDSAPICIMSDDDLALLVSRPNETVTSLCQLVPRILLLMSRGGGFECKHCTKIIATVSLVCPCGLAFHPGCLSRYLSSSPPTVCCAALLSGASATASEIRRGRRAKDIARTRLESRSTKLDALRCVDEGDTAAEHIETRDTGPPSTMPVTNESILEAILRIEAGVSEVRTTCTELKAGAVAMDAKLDKAIATLDVYDGRISAVEERQREIVGYMKRMKPCRAEDTINDVDSVRWLNPTASRRAAGGGAAAVPPTSRTLVVEYKQSITRDRVLSMKKEAGEILASALLPGASGVLRMYELHSKFTHNPLLKTKELASARGYAHVWVRDGLVCVRKSDGSEVIEVLTEMDLKSLL